MSYLEAATACFASFARVKGRASREQFWKFTLVVVIFLATAACIDVAIGYFFESQILRLPRWSQPLTSVYTVTAWVLAPPFVSCMIRRLHDTGRSGWSYCVNLLPVAGFALFVWWLAEKGSMGPNRYGADPDTALLLDVFA